MRAPFLQERPETPAYQAGAIKKMWEGVANLATEKPRAEAATSIEIFPFFPTPAARASSSGNSARAGSRRRITVDPPATVFSG
jgi:hypothetical protein